jgi:hypothetical protein
MTLTGECLKEDLAGEGCPLMRALLIERSAQRADITWQLDKAPDWSVFGAGELFRLALLLTMFV